MMSTAKKSKTEKKNGVEKTINPARIILAVSLHDINFFLQFFLAHFSLLLLLWAVTVPMPMTSSAAPHGAPLPFPSLTTPCGKQQSTKLLKAYIGTSSQPPSANLGGLEKVSFNAQVIPLSSLLISSLLISSLFISSFDLFVSLIFLHSISLLYTATLCFIVR